MKKTSSEIKFRSPRFVWCNGNKEICWAKDREKNDTKGKYKSMPVSDVVRIVAGTDDGIDASSNEGGESVSKKKKHKKKRGSLFAESLDSSQLVNMMTVDAVFTIVSNKGDHHSLTLVHVPAVLVLLLFLCFSVVNKPLPSPVLHQRFAARRWHEIKLQQCCCVL